MQLKKLNILSLVILFLLLSYNNIQAAAIHIERNDVDSIRAGFITAGYPFSLDIIIDSLDKFNGVSFELDWDRPDLIFFSEWQIGDIGDKSQAYVEKYPGKIIVAVANGLPLIESRISNTALISLKFVTLQSATNLDSVRFTFNKPTASALIDTQSQLLSLAHNPAIFKIHSYIDVFPGDANNDGMVDHLDYSNVMLYLGLGSQSQHSRTFKRLYPSIFWVPQKTLVWDMADATYADCDGNGEITMKDMLVVSYNLGKNTTHIGKSQPVIEKFPSISKISNKLLSDNNSYPVYFQTNRDFISAYISIELNQEYADNFESINVDNIFNENYEIAYKKQVGNIIYVFIGSNDRSNNSIYSGEILQLIFNNKIFSNFNIINNISGEAIDALGEIFPLNFYTYQQLTDISNNENNIDITLHSNSLDIYSNNIQIQSIQVFDILGRVITTRDNLATNSLIIELPNLSNQLLFITILTDNGDRIHYSIATDGFSHLQYTK
jgi:hypothetical protein